mmetsp:Transcript_10176/g.31048  ORF Transcript_10176/g.31048 Transcript_10176/m.31048 type:complete len:321 (+) Transcript_10176:1062-2024(+)
MKVEGVHNTRVTNGQRARLVKDKARNVASLLKGISALDENTVGGPYTRADHDCRGSGKAKGAWTSRNDNADAKSKAEGENSVAERNPRAWVGSRCPTDVPRQKSRHRKNHNDGHKVRRDLVRVPLNGSLGHLSRLHHLDDLGEGGVRPNFRGLHVKQTRRVHSAADHLVSRTLQHGDALPRDHGLVHVALAAGDHAVRWNLCARKDLETVPHVDERREYLLLRLDLPVLVELHENGRVRGELHELGDGVRGPGFGGGLQVLAKADERDKRGARLKEICGLVVRTVVVLVERVEEHGGQAVGVGRGRTQDDEDVHIGRSVP